MKNNQNFSVAGTSAHRVDGIEKVTGKAIYTSDIQLPGMAHARILRSPVAHAKVTNIEEATAPGAALVHEAGVARAELRGSVYGAPERFNGTNVCYYLTFGREEVAKGFAKAEHIFEDTFRFQKVQHYSLEAHNNIVYYDGEKLTVWAS